MRVKFMEIWPYLLIFLFVFVFFWKFFLRGLIPLPADITVGMYYPWLDYKWGYSVGVPVKNPILSDVVSQIFPYKIYALKLLKQGQLPLWNPFMFAGFPLLANMQIGIFNPTNILFFFLPVIKAWGLQIALQPLLAAVFTYIFFRFLKLGRLSSLLGGLIYAFSGFSVIWLEWGIHGFAVCFLPILLYFTALFYEEKKFFFGVLLSIFLALQIFSGYPQILIYSCLVLAIFVILKYKVWCKQTLFLIGFVLLGIGLAGIQLLPTIELYLVSQRLTETIAEDIAFLPWRNFITFFAPDFFGNHSTMNFWGVGNYTNSAGYSGIVTLSLAAIGISSFRKNRNTLFFIVALVVSLLLAFPTPLAVFIKQLKFVGLNALSATRILFLANFSLAALASFGFDLVLRERNKLSFRVVYYTMAAIIGILLGTFLSRRILNNALDEMNKSGGSYILFIWVKNLAVGLRNLIFPVGLTVASFVLFLFLKLKVKFLSNMAMGGLFILVIFELFRFGWKYSPFSKPELIFPSTPVIEFLQKPKGIFRVDGGDAIPMNMLMPYGIESFSAYDPLYPLRISQYLSLSDGNPITQPKSRYGKLDSFSSSLVDLANICYVTAVKKDQQLKPDANGVVDERFRINKFKKVFEDKTVAVLENTQCLPRAWLTRDVLIEKSIEKLSQRMTDKSINLRETVFIEKDLPFSLGEEEITKNEYINWIVRNSVKQKAEVAVNSPALLFIADSFYPGWEAFIDGRQAEIFRADFAFRAVFVPKGQHTVEFAYDPVTFKVGLIVSLISFMILAFFGLKLPLFKKKWL